MSRAQCWSSIVAGPSERSALQIDPGASWLVGCALTDGHTGLHASDGGGRGPTRRPWLLWGDFARQAQACRALDPCRTTAIDGAACSLFDGHGGRHRFPPTEAEAFTVDTWSAPPTPPTPAHAAPAHAAPAHAAPTHAARPVTPPSRLSPVDPPARQPAARPISREVVDPAMGSLLEIHDPVHGGQGALIDVVAPDGGTRTVLAPMTSRGGAAADMVVRPANGSTVGRSAPQASATPLVDALQASAAAAAEVITEAAQTAARLPDGAVSERHQIGESLRELAGVLTKLAERLDAR